MFVILNLSRQDGQVLSDFTLSPIKMTLITKKKCALFISASSRTVLLGAVCRLSRQDKYVNVQMCVVKSPVAAFAVKISIYRKI